MKTKHLLALLLLALLPLPLTADIRLPAIIGDRTQPAHGRDYDNR